MTETLGPTRAFNRLRLVFDRDLDFANLIDRACLAHGSVPIFHSDEPLPWAGLPKSMTSEDVRSFANRLGNVLRAKGLKRFDRVLIYKRHGPDYFFMALGIVRAGGICVPVHPRMGVNEVAEYAKYVGARFIITDPETYAARGLDAIAARLPVESWLFTSAPGEVSVPHSVLDAELRTASTALVPQKLARDADVLIVHTSGTTGFPKGVLCTNGAIMTALRINLAIQPMGRDNRALVVGPFNHYATHMSLFSSMAVGAPVWLMSQFDAARTLDCIDREQINVYVGFPDTYLSMYNHGLDQHRLDSVRVWMSAADAMHEVHIRAFTRKGAFARLFSRRLLSSVFVDSYGTSEIGFFALARYASSWSRRFGRMVGRAPLIGPRVKVADENGNPLPPLEVGRLMVKSPTLFKGYWNAHDRLHGTYMDGWWWTGDLGYRDRFGRFYHLDRAADTIHATSGTIYTLLLEEELLKHPSVGEAVVIGVPHPQRGVAPVAVIGPKSHMHIDEAQMLDEVNRGLPGDSRIEKIIPLPLADIPRGLTGKVLKRQLRERYASIFRPAAPVDANLSRMSTN